MVPWPSTELPSVPEDSPIQSNCTRAPSNTDGVTNASAPR